MKKYPSIEQFRSIIREVRQNHDYQGADENGLPIIEHRSPYPTLFFTGHVKIHGTNAAIVKYKNGEIKFQSRSRELSLTSDNAGFMLEMSAADVSLLFQGIEFKEYVAIYGEWCGSNIQSGVALSQLDRKVFVVFGAMVDDKWIDSSGISDPSQKIYNVSMFPTYRIAIDFNEPERSTNWLIEKTLEVEAECPAGNFFGLSGIGEGIVFTCDQHPKWRFKSKGEKHSSSKVKVINAVDIDELNSINEFVEYAVTENRLKQGLENVQAQEPRYTGDFIKWVIGDIIKEESDTIVANQIDMKKAGSSIARKCREFFIK